MKEQISSLVFEFVQKAREMSERVLSESENVSACYRREQESSRILREAQASLDDAVNSAVLDADYQAAQLKQGPFANMARTSEAYKLAVKSYRAEVLAGELSEQNKHVRRLESNHFEDSMALESAKTRYQAVRSISDLTSSALNALS